MIYDSALSAVALKTCIVYALGAAGFWTHAAARDLKEAPAFMDGAWTTIFEDNFDTPGPVDPTKWVFDIGNQDMSDPANPGPVGWGNGEPQYYTDRPENVKIVDVGDEAGTTALQITAQSEEFNGFGYTSARLKTANHPVGGAIMPPKNPDGSWVDGGAVRVEARALLPTGTVGGTWPAFWMLPTTPAYGIWPFSGEIDILEAVGKQIEFVSGIHFGGPWADRVNFAARAPCFQQYAGNATNGGVRDTLADAEYCNAGWRTWALEWGVKYVDGAPLVTLDFFADDVIVHTLTSNMWWTNEEVDGAVRRLDNPLAPFDQPFHIILNLSVGGYSFAGFPPADQGPYLQNFFVDYVRVMERRP